MHAEFKPRALLVLAFLTIAGMVSMGFAGAALLHA